MKTQIDPKRPSPTSDFMSDAAFADTRAVFLAQYGDQWWYNDHFFNAFNAKCQAIIPPPTCADPPPSPITSPHC